MMGITVETGELLELDPREDSHNHNSKRRRIEEENINIQSVEVEQQNNIVALRAMSESVPRDPAYFPQSLYGVRLVSNVGMPKSPHEIVRMLLNLEDYCDAAGALFNPYPQYNINVSLVNALRCPQAICTRTPNVGQKSLVINLENLKFMWCSMVAHYFEWIAGIPDLYQMAEDDRITLSVHQLCKVICFTIAFTTYRYRSDGLLFASGIYFPPNAAEYKVQPEVIQYVGRLLDVIQNKVIPVFKEVGLTYEEYVIVKLLLLFSADTTFLGPDPHNTRKVMREANRKYQHALIEHQKQRYPYLSQHQLGMRMVRMLSVLPYMEVVAELDQSSLSELIVLNKGDLQGELTYDIHLRSNMRRTGFT